MDAALWAAKTGLDAQQTEMSVISNNLANVNTTGYKEDRAVFEDLLYQNQTQVGADTSQTTQSPSGLSIGTGVQVVSTEKEYGQGSLTQTGNPLDVAIQGQGFFQIQMPDGTLAYSRDGTFQTNAQGQLVTSSGYVVQPGITIPQSAQSVTIGTDGTVTALLPGQSTPTQVGQLQLANFINPAGLQPIGQNLLVQSASSGSPQTGTPGVNGLGTVSQGELESSNVDVVEELVNMIQTQRAYEMNSKAISTVDSMLQYATENM
ncbi:MAG: flagellar basal-body rod protein FlgG [Steroidobacteraceae bacterium]